jgi:hypothetical protein
MTLFLGHHKLENDMSWIVKIEVVGEEQADEIIEVLNNAEEEVEISFAFNTSKTGNDYDAGLTVQNYFDLHLAKYGKENDINGGREMPIESVCGVDCKIVIDTCAEFCRHIKAASGDNNTHTETALEAAWEVCEIYING